jgi:hypothetical protein
MIGSMALRKSPACPGPEWAFQAWYAGAYSGSSRSEGVENPVTFTGVNPGITNLLSRGGYRLDDGLDAGMRQAEHRA